MLSTLAPLDQLFNRLAAGSFKESPFPLALIDKARKIVAQAIVEHNPEYQLEKLLEVPERQPFYLFLLAAFRQMLRRPRHQNTDGSD